MDKRSYLSSYVFRDREPLSLRGVYGTCAVSRQEMQDCIELNDPDALIALSDSGGSRHFDSKNYKNSTSLLMHAVLCGAWRNVPVIMSYGADPYAVEINGASALMMASMRDDLLCMTSILSNEGNVDESNEDGETALMLAAAKGSGHAVELLVRQGADVDAASVWGSPVHYACANGHYKVFRQLLEYGADVDARDHKLCTPLMTAALAGKAHCVQTALSGNCDVLARNSEGMDALAIAVSAGDVAMVKLLGSAGADFSAKYGRKMVSDFVSSSSEPLRQVVAKGMGRALHEVGSSERVKAVEIAHHRPSEIFPATRRSALKMAGGM